jgi:hypothetical protein
VESNADNSDNLQGNVLTFNQDSNGLGFLQFNNQNQESSFQQNQGNSPEKGQNNGFMKWQ